jgi:hypothetical protein
VLTFLVLVFTDERRVFFLRGPGRLGTVAERGAAGDADAEIPVTDVVDVE